MEELLERIGAQFGEQIDQFIEKNAAAAMAMSNVGAIYTLCGDLVKDYGSRTYVKNSEIWIEDVHIGVNIDANNQSMAYLLRSPTTNMLVDNPDVLMIVVRHLVPVNK